MKPLLLALALILLLVIPCCSACDQDMNLTYIPNVVEFEITPHIENTPVIISPYYYPCNVYLFNEVFGMKYTGDCRSLPSEIEYTDNKSIVRTVVYSYVEYKISIPYYGKNPVFIYPLESKYILNMEVTP